MHGVATGQVKSRGAIVLALATILALILSMYATIAVQAVSSGTVKTVYGDTYYGGSEAGWLFNRDSSTSTPIEFNTNMPSIGSGSLEVLPIGATPADKFVGEYFVLAPVETVDSFSYDFKIAGSGDVTDANEFYMNVYTLVDDSYGNYYDCRFDYIPAAGSTSDFTTFSVDLNDAANVVKKASWSAYSEACPSSPSEMPDGSHIFFFQLNLGDTLAGDAGVGGFFDNVVVTRGEDVTTYDFEPAPEKVWICHATSSAVNPYTHMEVPLSAIDGGEDSDHSSHTGDAFDPNIHNQQNQTWGDIVPPVEGVNDGQNWTAAGYAIWANNCDVGSVLGAQCEVGPGWMSYVLDYQQGTNKGGGEIGAERSDPQDATGAADVAEPTVAGFYSLGVDGWITLSVNGYAVNVDGADLSFHEATFGNRQNYPEESAVVEVSQDGDAWIEIGLISNHDTDGGDGVSLLDFDSSGYDWVKFVRISDTTPYDEHTNSGDGYDLDAVDISEIACEEPQPTTFVVAADKVVCVAEEFLPNWGAGGSDITETTAQDFVAQNSEACQLVDWDFQWRDANGNPGDNIGIASDPWVTFTDEIEIPVEGAGDDQKLWVREVVDESWVPFTGANTSQDYSAEMYCHTDVKNYDNYDYIQKVVAGETYYCVGFNAPAVPDCAIGNSIFQIGEDEAAQTDHPADEFSWNGAFGDWSRPMDDPFQVPFSPDERFPWNSNHNQAQATDFDVTFYVGGDMAIPETVLNVGWAPGTSGTETKEIYLDGNLVGTVTRDGASVGGWYKNMQVFDEVLELGVLETGWHTLTFMHTSGDGTLWDYVNLEVANCDWNTQIQGQKYRDVNTDGRFNQDERVRDNRLGDWPIYLFDGDMNQIDMMYTGDDSTEAGNVSRGQYRFVNLAPGTYYVCEGQQAGWVQTQPSEGLYNEDLGTYCYQVVIGGNNTAVNGRLFGNTELGQVNAWKFVDENQNGEYDEDEPYTSWDFVVFNDAWGEVQTELEARLQQTDDPIDSDETYERWSQANLAPGTYYICEAALSGWLQSVPASDEEEYVVTQEYSNELFDYCHMFTIDESGEEVDVLFGNYPVGEVQGRKYHDVNANGSFDQEERQADGNVNRLNGWTINLYDTDWNLVDSMVTGNDETAAGNVGRGQYRFVNVPLGDYYICEVAQEGWTQTQPADGPQLEDDSPFCRELTLEEAGERVTGQRFGNYEAVAEVQGVVYNDEDSSELQNGDEPELEGWEVWLLTQNSPYTVRDVFSTGSDGTYSFTNLPYGRYWVCQGVQSGWYQTQLNNAGTGGIDFSAATIGSVLDLDDDSVANFCYEVVLSSDNQVSVENDFGNFATVLGVDVDLNPDEGGAVLGLTTDGSGTAGEVLGAETLAETGQGIALSALLGSGFLLAASYLAFATAPVRNKH